MEEKIVYFETGGEHNTGETLKLARERAAARGIKKMVVASTRGDTARAARDVLMGSGVGMVVIPHQYGFGQQQRFPQSLVSELEQQGHHVHFGTMLFHTEDLYGNRAPRIMATVLRAFCQGMKVGVEITLMACDGGLVGPGEKVISVAGTGLGADTALVLTAAPSTRLGDLHIHEIICKPL
jgi:hypothetical protein